MFEIMQQNSEKAYFCCDRACAPMGRFPEKKPTKNWKREYKRDLPFVRPTPQRKANESALFIGW
jgi:hypothetical protein